MLDTEQKTAPTTAEIREDNYQPTPHRSIASIIVVSVIFGALSGFFGAGAALSHPNWVAHFSKNSAIAQTQTVTLTEDSAIIDVVQKASPAVVSIVASKDLNSLPGYGADPFSQDPFYNFFFGRGSQQPSTPNVQEVSAGTGFFITNDGTIVTNKHVVQDTQASYTVLTNDGKKYDAQVLSRDPVNDLAIVKIKIQNAPKLDLADSAHLQVGQRVIAIGNSLGQYQNTVTSGIISGIGRKITAGDLGSSEQLSGVIQTDAAINPGNSGGPLLNVSGQVIGINTAIDQQGQLVGFAIPSNEASKAIVSFQKNGKITRPYLGVRYVIITTALAQQEKLPKDYGALVLRGQTASDFAVIPGSPADKAGIVENDILEEVNGTKIDTDHTLADLLNSANVGDTINLKVYDKGREKDVKVKLEDAK